MAFRAARLRKEWLNILFNLVFAILTLILTILFYRSVWLAVGLLVIVMVFGMLKWRSPLVIFVFIFGALFGTFSEIVAIRYGVWTYAISNVAGVPFWLFVVWGNAAMFFYQMAVEFERLGFHR